MDFVFRSANASSRLASTVSSSRARRSWCACNLSSTSYPAMSASNAASSASEAPASMRSSRASSSSISRIFICFAASSAARNSLCLARSRRWTSSCFAVTSLYLSSRESSDRVGDGSSPAAAASEDDLDRDEPRCSAMDSSGIEDAVTLSSERSTTPTSSTMSSSSESSGAGRTST